MSKSLFTLITAGEMDTLLCKGGFEKVEMTDGTKEFVYDRPYKTLPNVVIRVYTSIDSEVSRGIGEDAIRVCLVDTRINRGISRVCRTHRSVGWADRLRSKINEIFLSVSQLKRCRMCDYYMIERENKSKNKFLGCSNFPNCKHTESIPCQGLRI